VLEPASKRRVQDQKTDRFKDQQWRQAPGHSRERERRARRPGLIAADQEPQQQPTAGPPTAGQVNQVLSDTSEKLYSTAPARL